MTTVGGANAPAPLGPRAQRIATRIERCILLLTTHWLAILATFGIVMTALPVLAPILRSRQLDMVAEPIYVAYQLMCHQRPERSFHLFGEQMAFCQRDLAIYGMAVGVALAYGIARRYTPSFSRIPFRLAMLFALPMAIDGVTQLAGLRESTWQLRIGTGALFSLGVGTYALPLLNTGFETLRADIVGRLEQPVPSDGC